MAKQAVTRAIVKASVECPVCGKAKGFQCVGVNKYAKSLHTERWALFWDLKLAGILGA